MERGRGESIPRWGECSSSWGSLRGVFRPPTSPRRRRNSSFRLADVPNATFRILPNFGYLLYCVSITGSFCVYE